MNIQNDPELQRYRTAFIGACDLTIDEKLEQTRQLHEKLRAVWEIEQVYDIMFAVFPNQEDYDALPIDETVLDSGVHVKYQILTEGFASTTITYHRPS